MPVVSWEGWKAQNYPASNEKSSFSSAKYLACEFCHERIFAGQPFKTNPTLTVVLQCRLLLWKNELGMISGAGGACTLSVEVKFIALFMYVFYQNKTKTCGSFQNAKSDFQPCPSGISPK